MKQNIFIGTAGWSYKDWLNVFYPKTHTQSFDWLTFYSQYFNCVEVNSTYYTYISKQVAENWISRIEDVEDFQFTIKLNKDFTHLRKFKSEEINKSEAVFQNLSFYGRLGGILLQFPYSFQLSQTNLHYLLKVCSIFEQYNLIVEFRHQSWIKEEILNCFSENRLNLCLIDQPEIGKSFSLKSILTYKTLYVRLHGRNEDAWESSVRNFGKQQNYEEQNERYNYLYSLSELIEIEQQLEDSIFKAEEVYFITNNHPKGNAVANAFELKYLLKGRERVEIPSTLNLNFKNLNMIKK